MAKKPTPSSLTGILGAPFEPADVTALAALFLGTASSDQQKRAIEWILLHACRINSTTFHENPAVSQLLQGRRQAGLIIRMTAQTTADAAKALEDQQKDEA